MNNENLRNFMRYRTAMVYLSRLEDRLGYTPELELFERQVNTAIDMGKNMSFVINAMALRLDDLSTKDV